MNQEQAISNENVLRVTFITRFSTVSCAVEFQNPGTPPPYFPTSTFFARSLFTPICSTSPAATSIDIAC
jgi:hypothetical protein